MAEATRELWQAWTGLGLAPLATAVSFQTRYMMVPFACQAGSNWPLHAVSLIAIALTGFGLLSAIRTWQKTGRGVPGEQEGPMNRNRFLGVLGMGFSATMLLMLVFQLIPALVLDPCTIG
jgi:hypothetical protein